MVLRLPAESDLSLHEKIAQLAFVRIGSNLPPILRVEEDESRVAQLLEACPVGGLLLFNGGSEAKASLARLQARSNVPLLVASDVERGVGQQVKGCTLFPHAMAFDHSDRGIGLFIESVAREAADVGIHITFAPVADVNTNPLNPIISIRAFSDDAERASLLTAEYVTLAEEAGLLTTAKHFPGHGDTRQDSHDSLPLVSKSLGELRQCELRPFQAAIDAGGSLIMTAHVAFPNIDASGAPATLSRVLLKDVLRDEMGFQGVVCSDSLLMAGVRDLFANEGEMSLATLLAGVDMLLDLQEPATVVDYLVGCVESGRLPASRVNEAFNRVYSLKRKVFGQQGTRTLSPTGAVKTSAGTETQFSANAAAVAADAVRVVETRRPLLPFDREKPLTAILLKPFETPIDPPEQPLAAALRERFRDVRYAQLGPKSEAVVYQAATKLARAASQLVMAMIVRPAAWHAFGLRPEQREFVCSIIRERPEAVLVCLGVPYALDDYPDAAMRICTYSDVPVSQQALADYLLA
jgi:beta-glucosidase-like glycosyl hydrolase